MESFVSLQDVSVRFRTYQGSSNHLKETALRLLRPPQWAKKAGSGRQEMWGLKGINLDLREGDRLGIIGRNGAGKSTLLKVICRIYRPTEGALGVQGRIASLIEIGAGFNPELSGRENAYLNGSILGLSRRVVTERLESMVQFSELQEFIDMPVKYYSTGMHLRLAFSIATEIPPDILILDELYAGGDASFIERANERLREFIKRSRILILVAHNMDYVQEFCTRVIVLDHGQIIAQGEPAEMIRRYLAFCHGDATAFGGHA